MVDETISTPYQTATETIHSDELREKILEKKGKKERKRKEPQIHVGKYQAH